MRAKVVRSLGEYFETVRRIRGRWKVAKRYELWFRAESAAHKRTHLQPGIYRPRETGKRRSVKRLLALENELYEEFRRCASQLSDIKPDGEEEWEWDSYFLMQHHGVPTRLLDWSDGALIALHFAVRDKPIPPKTGSIIYILDPYWLLEHLDKQPDRKEAQGRWKKYCDKHPHDAEKSDWDRLYLPYDDDDEPDPLLATPGIPLLWDSPHLSRRVAAQRSRFMIFGSNPTWLADLAKRSDSRLASTIIPVGSISRIKQELKDAGVTESVVFPDLDGLGRELKQVWRDRI
jgi:hypothetical protein